MVDYRPDSAPPDDRNASTPPAYGNASGLRAHRTGEAGAAVVLVNMPFAGFRQPSLACGLLKASLAPLRVRVLVIDATLAFADMITPETYDMVGTWRAEDLLGDRIFADYLPHPPARTWTDYEEQVLAGGLPEHRVAYFGKPPLDDTLRARLQNVRARAGELLATTLAEIVAARPAVVGFTNMVHQQAAALSLAARVRDALPHACIVFGGASCRGEMGAELLRSFPFLDAVVTGDGEQVLSELVSGRLANEPLVGLPGLLVAGDAGAAHSDGGGGAAPTGDAGAGEGSAADLDRLPTPDYGDYFDRLSGSPLAGSFVSRVPFETSRGCWWGERRRCIFCGQASASMLYRQKSPDRAVDELVELARRHPGSPVIVTDEILPRNAFDRFLPRAHEALPELEIVYFEVRADLDRSQLRTLAESGVQRVEAGLESLSTPVLKIIRKGTAMLQNLQFLKWARELAIDIVWNLLWGLPGEEPEDYESMAALVPLITHLQPPNTVGPFRLDRFSPAYQRSSELGMASVRPYPSYSHVYALQDQALQRLAYSFAFDYADKRPVELYTMALAEQIAAWKEAWPHSVLAFADHGDNLVFYDRRPGFDEEELTVIDGVHRAAYLACDSARSLKRLTEILSADLGTTVSADEVREVAESLIDERLMIADGETYLSLALRMPAGLGTAPREAGA